MIHHNRKGDWKRWPDWGLWPFPVVHYMCLHVTTSWRLPNYWLLIFLSARSFDPMKNIMHCVVKGSDVVGEVPEPLETSPSVTIRPSNPSETHLLSPCKEQTPEKQNKKTWWKYRGGCEKRKEVSERGRGTREGPGGKYYHTTLCSRVTVSKGNRSYAWLTYSYKYS